jgi:hypothetical protein
MYPEGAKGLPSKGSVTGFPLSSESKSSLNFGILIWSGSAPSVSHRSISCGHSTCYCHNVRLDAGLFTLTFHLEIPSADT